jgi:hypothetical protein
MNQEPDKKEKGDAPLTCIHDAYTLHATPEDGGEAERVMVRHFLATLAEVALAVAARKGQGKEGEQ